MKTKIKQERQKQINCVSFQNIFNIYHIYIVNESAYNINCKHFQDEV